MPYSFTKRPTGILSSGLDIGAIHDRLQTYKSEMVATLSDLVKIPSVEGPAKARKPFGPDVDRALQFTLQLCDRLGFRTHNLESYVGYAEWSANPAQRRMIAALLHLDIVPAGEGWTHPPFAGIVEGGRIYGRGAQDDKGPAVATIYAVKALMDLGYVPKKRVRLIFGTNEETGSRGVKRYAATQELPYAGFVPDATYPLVNAEKAILGVRLEAGADSQPGDIGHRAGHSEGANAEDAGSRDVGSMDARSMNAMPTDARSMDTRSMKTRYEGISGILIESVNGGTRPNVIPNVCTAVLSLKEDAWGSLESAVSEFNRTPPHKAELARLDGLVDSRTSGQVRAQLTVYGRLGHASMPETGVNAITHAAQLLASLPGIGPKPHAELIKLIAERLDGKWDGSGLGIDWSDEESGALTVSVGVIEVSASSAVARLDIRHPLSSKADEILQRIAESSRPYGVKAIETGRTPGLLVRADSELVTRLLSVYSMVTGEEAKPISIGGGTYARSMPNMVAFGPVFPDEEGMAHKADEYIEIDRLMLDALIYGAAIAELTVEE